MVYRYILYNQLLDNTGLREPHRLPPVENPHLNLELALCTHGLKPTVETLLYLLLKKIPYKQTCSFKPVIHRLSFYLADSSSLFN